MKVIQYYGENLKLKHYKISVVQDIYKWEEESDTKMCSNEHQWKYRLTNTLGWH